MNPDSPSSQTPGWTSAQVGELLLYIAAIVAGFYVEKYVLCWVGGIGISRLLIIKGKG